jgi:hypothetical protein
MSVAVVAIFAVALDDVFGQRRVGEVRGTAGEPGNVFGTSGVLMPVARVISPSMRSKLSPRARPASWIFTASELVARSFGEDLDAGSDLANDGRPHGPLF